MTVGHLTGFSKALYSIYMHSLDAFYTPLGTVSTVPNKVLHNSSCFKWSCTMLIKGVIHSLPHFCHLNDYHSLHISGKKHFNLIGHSATFFVHLFGPIYSYLMKKVVRVKK